MDDGVEVEGLPIEEEEVVQVGAAEHVSEE